MSGEENGRAVEQIGVLGSCLIEGDAEQKTRERKTKRRALVISVLLQSLTIVAIVMVPLLGHTEKISYRSAIPMPPYRHAPPRRAETSSQPAAPNHTECITCFNRRLSPNPPTRSALTHAEAPRGDGLDIDATVPNGAHLLGGIDSGRGPLPPEDPNRNQRKRISVGGRVQQAMMLHRVEPCYPALAKQLRRSGQVRIQALISTDGAVESLQLIDGDPLFVQCSMDAVRQWRYRPTSLNGTPVEVETVITVVFTLNP